MELIKNCNHFLFGSQCLPLGVAARQPKSSWHIPRVTMQSYSLDVCPHPICIGSKATTGSSISLPAVKIVHNCRPAEESQLSKWHLVCLARPGTSEYNMPAISSLSCSISARRRHATGTGTEHLNTQFRSIYSPQTLTRLNSSWNLSHFARPTALGSLFCFGPSPRFFQSQSGSRSAWNVPRKQLQKRFPKIYIFLCLLIFLASISSNVLHVHKLWSSRYHKEPNKVHPQLVFIIEGRRRWVAEASASVRVRDYKHLVVWGKSPVNNMEYTGNAKRV